jgi:hypothetical protein
MGFEYVEERKCFMSLTSMTNKDFVARTTKWMIGALVLLVLVGANIATSSVAMAHSLNGSWPNDYHWHKSGTQIVLRVFIDPATVNKQAAEKARVDGWNKIGILYNNRVYDPNYAEVRVWDGNYGNVGWSGYGGFDRIISGTYHGTRGYAIYNTYTGWSQAPIQAIFCQEMGHAWGLGHSNTGDCMGFSYHNWTKYYYGSHNNNDFYNMYRYHR